MRASIVIRTLNEAKHLPALLEGISKQDYDKGSVETVLVDSGSTDGTVDIARGFGARVHFIEKEEFSFGRSLNIGCEAATGEVLVFVSGHCVPASDRWLSELLAPLHKRQAVYSYGKQLGGDDTRFSEAQIFAKYFPDNSRVSETDFFCNNANSALLKQVWEMSRFDEELTGLEDLEMAKRIIGNNGAVAYVAEAPVFHLHDENWRQIRRRFEREAIALQHIMPEVQMNWSDFVRYVTSAIMLDCGAAIQQKRLRQMFGEIVLYRTMQFWGSYRGNRIHREISRKRKDAYYYPR